MNSPYGPDSDRAEGPSHQMVTTNDPAMLASSAWVPPSPMWLDGAPGEEGLDFSVFLHCLRRRCPSIVHMDHIGQHGLINSAHGSYREA